MCWSGRTVVVMVAAILYGECALAHRSVFRWDPIHQQLPIDAMIDVVNRLTVDVLQDFAFSRGNFAFSPYGATSVLVALYEGSRGESARQIHAALRLPWNHDVIRIGFRDLHRKLRVYFVHEGFLNGLTFNKNRTEFRPEYIRALRFYGYEVEPANPVTSPPLTSQSPPNATINTVPTTTEVEPFSATLQSSESSSNGEVTTEEQPTSTSASEITTENGLETTNSETTTAVIEKSTESTSEVEYSPTTKLSITETSDLPTESSQTTTIETTTASQTLENVEPTSGGELTTGIQVTTEDPAALTTDERAVSTVVATEGTGSVQETETPQGNSQVTTATSGLVDKTTEVSNTETTVSNSVSEQTTVISTLSSEPNISTTKDIGSATEQPSTIYVTETSELLDAKTTSIPKDTTQSNLPETSTSQLTTENIILDTSAVSSSTDSTTSVSEIGNIVTTIQNVGTTDITSTSSTLSEGVETTATVTDVNILTTDYLSTSPPNEETATPSSSPNPEETSTHSEEHVTISVTNSPDTVTRNARDTLAASTWLSDIILGQSIIQAETPRRLVKRSFIETPSPSRHGEFNLQLQNGMLDAGHARGLNRQSGPQLRQPFLVDGVVEEKVPVVSYTAALPFAFVPRLDALVLELPLENKWQRLVILLPLERRGLHELIYEMGSFPLGQVLRSLHRTRVNVIIPLILVEGFVVLTPTLQKLGIWNVFDPQRADLSGMSSDPELYVRDLEQTITVDISSKSKIPELNTRSQAARHRMERFIATHPFLYFVVDRDTKVPLIAGKMVDPLNSRIH